RRRYPDMTDLRDERVDHAGQGTIQDRAGDHAAGGKISRLRIACHIGRAGGIHRDGKAHVGVGPAVSTVLATPPSIDTLAIPQMLHLSPIQLTAVPVKVNVAVPEPRVIRGPVGL